MLASPGHRHTIGLARRWHLGLDTLWLANGTVFHILLFTTGQWLRVVPLHWDVIPNAISVAIQYLPLDWPVETGWTQYNGLQLLAYFVFFIVTHVTMVLTTGARANLNHMFASRNDGSWWGLAIFAAASIKPPRTGYNGTQAGALSLLRGVTPVLFPPAGSAALLQRR